MPHARRTDHPRRLPQPRLLTAALGLALAAGLAPQAALAQAGAGVLAQTARDALATSPDVAARASALQAATEEREAAAAGFLPRLDLSAEIGRTQDRADNRTPASQSFNRSGVALTASQLLWDGQATRREVDRLGHARLARYFDLVDVSEQAAVEAARAHHDVQRYRRLVQLAEDNYVQHKVAADQIQSRFRAGVGRGVDLEQAGARLALAESNLITERANLHDVTERYGRIVGRAPGLSGTPTVAPLPAPLPAGIQDALDGAAMGNPQIAAAVEQVRSTRAQAQARGSAFQPRVEARLRAGGGNNFDGVVDQRRDVTGQIVLNWNLFAGGADQARERQAAQQLTQAEALRDKACRDVRQTVAIAHNDARKLTEQLGLLERNVIAIEKARDAYRQQFDIGQRSLLDLLNAENELYTARRAYANAEYDLGIAQARTLGAMGRLLSTLGLAPPPDDAANGWSAGGDAATRCPLAPTALPVVAQAELDARARALAVAAPAVPAVAPAPAPAPAATAPDATLVQRANAWAAAWSSKNVDAYLAFYALDFTPASGTRAAWAEQRRARLSVAGAIRVELSQVSVQVLSPTRAETRFTQAYTADHHSDTSARRLQWERVGNDWLITSESGR